MVSAQLRERTLQSPYRNSDEVRGRGSAVTSFCHTSSLQSGDRITPSNHGIKQRKAPVGIAAQSARFGGRWAVVRYGATVSRHAAGGLGVA